MGYTVKIKKKSQNKYFKDSGIYSFLGILATRHFYFIAQNIREFILDMNR